MAIYVDQMFNTDGESTSLADMNDGVSSSTGDYTPLKDGKLLKILIFVGGEAATSLVEDVRIEMTNTEWTPNTLRFAANGSGLRTAPAPQHRPFEYVVDQPVAKNSPISAQYIHDSGSPVTSRIRVFGVFQA
jgi:hypothetical protein